MKVVIMRGLPGSGKSFLVRQMCPDGTAVICSADDFRYRDVTVNGVTTREYFFDTQSPHLAHVKCYRKFIDAVTAKKPLVVVDNTNIRKCEYENYVALAENLGYKVEILEVRAVTTEDVNLCIERNTHKVPSEVIARFAATFELDEKAKVVGIMK